jgi:hypothetical protein
MPKVIQEDIDSQSNKPQPDASKQVCFEVDGELREAGRALIMQNSLRELAFIFHNLTFQTIHGYASTYGSINMVNLSASQGSIILIDPLPCCIANCMKADLNLDLTRIKSF